jgi:hypothetical protein
MAAALVLIGASVGGGYIAGNSAPTEPVPLAITTDDPRSIATIDRDDDHAKKIAVSANLTLEELAIKLCGTCSHPAPGELYLWQWVEIITPDKCAGLIEILDAKHRHHFHQHDQITSRVFGRWIDADPHASADAAMQRWQSGIAELWQTRGLIGSAMEKWGSTDALAAREWLDAQTFPKATAKALSRSLFTGMARTNPVEAIDVLVSMPWEDRKTSIIAMDCATPEVLDKIARIPDEDVRSEIYSKCKRLVGTVKTEEYQQMKFTKNDAGWAAIQKVASFMFGFSNDTPKLLNFLWENAPEEARPAICSAYIAPLKRDHPEATSMWMKEHHLTEESVQASIRSLERK